MHHLSQKRLEEVVDNNARNCDNLLNELRNEKSLINLIINDNILCGKDGNYHFLCLVYRAFGIISDSDAHILKPFISRVCVTNFHKPVHNYLRKFDEYLKPDNGQYAHRSNVMRNIDTFSDLVKFVRRLQITCELFSDHKLIGILDDLNFAFNMCIKHKHIAMVNQTTINAINEIKTDYEKGLSAQTPINFRVVSIIPTYKDIHNYSPTLPNGVIKGKHKSVDQYLDEQFRCVREQYVQPLRQAIVECMNAISNNYPLPTALKNVNVYTKVRFNKIIDGKNEIQLYFDACRLSCDSLLCLSYDYFKTFCFGTVVGDTDANKRTKGLFTIKLETQSLIDEFINETLSLTILESRACFRSDSQVLTVLLRFNSKNFPLQKHLIKLVKKVKNPPYLDQKTVYDLTHLAQSLQQFCAETDINGNSEVNVANEGSVSQSFDFIQMFNFSIENLLEEISISNCTSWPKSAVLGFDRSQREAYKAALTKQLAIIDGASGTGKTYIGQRIVQTLIRNQKYWNGEVDKNNHKPILIICNTSHALNHFLEGLISCIDNSNGMAILSDTNNSERLQSYTLNNIKNRIIRQKPNLVLESEEELISEISKCGIIGMTAVDASTYRSIIESIDPSILVIDEAAEVYESHAITALTKSMNHLILIGDQFQPYINKKFVKSVSLFERLVNNGIQYNQLKVQHRMHPSISSLLVPHFYGELRDYQTVKDYENIKGITKNMYFLNHYELGSYTYSSQNKYNSFEAEFAVNLCKYLIQQNYKKSQISILVTCWPQLFEVVNCMKKYNNIVHGVRVSRFEDYMGEESDIIIVSFARCNIRNIFDGKFLKLTNRIKVALSRARMGLYCIGNFNYLANHCELWPNIKQDLEAKQSIGFGLELCCQKHLEYKTIVSNPSDFNKVFEGGCDKPCKAYLKCGHLCSKTCHVYDSQHKAIKCFEICNKIHVECEHMCTRRCHFDDADCGVCEERVSKMSPSCGHRISMKCCDNPSTIQCTLRCDRVLLCGHKCSDICDKLCDASKCSELIKTNIKCGHLIDVKCSTKNDPQKLSVVFCPEKCGFKLDCGHNCQGICGRCARNGFHFKCKMKCERKLICGHECNALCGYKCSQCTKFICEYYRNQSINQNIAIKRTRFSD